jgi:hypothetical protein
LDDAADVVETSYLMMGLLSARAYFNGSTVKERYLVKRINEMWFCASKSLPRGMADGADEEPLDRPTGA